MTGTSLPISQIFAGFQAVFLRNTSDDYQQDGCQVCFLFCLVKLHGDSLHHLHLHHLSDDTGQPCKPLLFRNIKKKGICNCGQENRNMKLQHEEFITSSGNLTIGGELRKLYLCCHASNRARFLEGSKYKTVAIPTCPNAYR
jgi:hypothetical protein